MSKIIFVADVFAEHHLGGGELSNQELIRQLILRGHDVETKLSAAIYPTFKKTEKIIL